MIKQYSVREAQETILRRRPPGRDDYSPALMKSMEVLFGAGVTPPDAVRTILAAVETDGDQALQQWTKLLDDVQLDDFVVPPERIAAAFEYLSDAVRQSMQRSTDRIRAFHERQPITSWISEDLGGRLGQRFTTIERVGVYVPGGTAPLPSSLLMSVIPAQVAGVNQIVVCTPPPVYESILAAAHLCGVTDLFQIGGAQAIAALAFGTETVPKVDKIVGAGNLFVTLAKQQLYGVVGLDGLAGPTETMVIADAFARPAWVAADLLAQAEHDAQATAILLTTDREQAEAVSAEVARQLEKLSRREIVAASLENRGGIILVDSLDQAAEIANNFAAEHLCLSVSDPEALLMKIDHAGGFFLGEHSYEVLGDYVAGPSHVMPTGGTARFASPLNVLDFVKLSSIIALDPQTAGDLGPDAILLSQEEQLTAHAAAAQARREERA